MGNPKRLSRKGFSLIELMIVVAIIGILGAIAIPGYLGIQKKSQRSEFKTNLEVLRVLQEKRYAELGRYVAGANTAALKGLFGEFRPGDPDDLLYEYSVVFDDGTDQTFQARATGKAKGPDPGKVFGLNQNNERTIDGVPAKW